MLTAARLLFLAFLNICLFKKRPQDIPESANLLLVCLIGYSLTATMLLAITETASRSLLSVLLEVVVMFLFTLGLLKLSGKMRRWIQTLTALTGTGVVMSLIALPVYLLMGFYGSSQPENDPVYTLVLLVLAVLALWNIAVMAHVLRNALDTGMFTSVMLAISYIWIMLSISASLFPSEFA